MFDQHVMHELNGLQQEIVHCGGVEVLRRLCSKRKTVTGRDVAMAVVDSRLTELIQNFLSLYKPVAMRPTLVGTPLIPCAALLMAAGLEPLLTTLQDHRIADLMQRKDHLPTDVLGDYTSLMRRFAETTNVPLQDALEAESVGLLLPYIDHCENKPVLVTASAIYEQ